MHSLIEACILKDIWILMLGASNKTHFIEEHAYFRRMDAPTNIQILAYHEPKYLPF